MTPAGEAAMPAENLLTGTAAVRFGMTEFRLRSAIREGVINPPRVGRYAVFPADKLPEYRRLLKAAGYLPARPGVAV